MKLLTPRLATYLIGAITFFSFNTNISAAKPTYPSFPPTPSQPSPPESLTYISTNVKGDRFYGVTPFSSKQTSDRNIFVASWIVLKYHTGVTQVSYVQINCGQLRYRDLIPWINIDESDHSTWRNPDTYQWRGFTSGSSFEKVGKHLCEVAASDRGIQWVWYR